MNNIENTIMENKNDDYKRMLKMRKNRDEAIIDKIEESFILIDPNVGLPAGINDFFIGFFENDKEYIKVALYRYDRLTDKVIKVSEDFDIIYHYGILFNTLSDYYIAANYKDIQHNIKEYMLFKYDEITDKSDKIISKSSYSEIIDYIKSQKL